jgi:nucleotide-binding universal stress UspA family protein
VHALQAAARFFPDQKLSTFHAYEAPFAGITSDSARYEDRKVAAGQLATFVATLDLPHRRKRGSELLVECGEPDLLIRQYVRDRGVDLALGTHGRSALFDVPVGSTAKRILSALSCDALVVREPRAAVESAIASWKAGLGRRGERSRTLPDPSAAAIVRRLRSCGRAGMIACRP